MPDNVNHPAHYETNGIECIDAMVASQGVNCVMDYCLCNAFKYIWRCQRKGKRNEDIRKAIWYLNKYVELDNETLAPLKLDIDADLRTVKQEFQTSPISVFTHNNLDD